MRQQVGRPIAITAVVLALMGWVGGGDVAAQGSKSDSVVKVNAKADKPGPDGKQVITLTLNINPGWHTYANPVQNEGLAAVQTKVTVEGKGDAQIDYPTGKLIDDKALGEKYSVYEGEVAIKATVNRGSDAAPVRVKVKFQACNDKTCLMPATVEVQVP